MAGPWKEWESKGSFPTLPTVPWKSRRKREISTFPQPGVAAMEKWKTQSRFSTFPPPLATMTPVLSLKNQKPKKGSRPLRGLLTPHPVLPPVDGISCSSFN